MRYLSVCSGIEAASVAWHPLGWSPIAFSEIDPFPSAVLAHRYGSNMPGEELSSNGVPNLGDMTKFREWPDYADVDVLVGGTPCQDYSIAGKRAGMAGERGQLTLTFVELLERYRPTWFVWENVPGVLSSNGGRDFATFLRDVGECGYGWAYRVLDAQYVRTCRHRGAVPQRRRRVFFVGYLGDWRPPAAVFLEPEGMRGDSAPRRKAGQGIAADVAGSTRSGSHWDGTGVHPSLNQSHNTGGIGASNQEIFSQRGAGLVAARMVAFGEYEVDGTASAMKARDHKDATDLVAHTLKGEGHDASEDGTGRGVPIIPFDLNQITSKTNRSQPSSEVHHTLPATAMPPHLATPYTITERGREGGQALEYRQDGTANAILTPNGGRGGMGVGAIAQPWAVRRLSPVECERLQGFPDGWTDVPYRKRQAADGPRYKALGNSMAVNCMEYIGRRIDLVRIAMAENQASREAAE